MRQQCIAGVPGVGDQPIPPVHVPGLRGADLLEGDLRGAGQDLIDPPAEMVIERRTVDPQGLADSAGSRCCTGG